MIVVAIVVSRSIHITLFYSPLIKMESKWDCVNSQTGRKLWLDLDNIFPRCWRDNASGISSILELRDCINNRLKKCKDDVSCLKRDADSAEHTAKTVFNDVIKESDKCLNDAYSASQSNITLAKEVFDRCLTTSCKRNV